MSGAHNENPPKLLTFDYETGIMNLTNKVSESIIALQNMSRSV